MKKDEQIIQTALKLFVDNGFHGTATSKIAQESGVANGTLFNYFATKEILIVSIHNSITKKMDDFIMESLGTKSVSKESFRKLFLASLDWNLNNRLEFQYLQQFNSSPYSKSLMARILNINEHPLYVLIKNGIDLVLLKPMPPALIFSLFTSQVNGLFYYLIANETSVENTKNLTEQTFDLFWNMIED
ncbi:TetR/AcrR family transcriptional regulator [Flavobacterium sp.]|uniref:TetR/AcrR family transcriptional regulator n=1 Tax=Flavobacterium sp. TaxID=239 RepID=UPI002C128C97|nr:TetR/AcrR family transcriptional regulator [Flavobacterium sp.]HSD06607.1 TetR/AcrR family transcriptional regulator [Flavobacterium sp.]